MSALSTSSSSSSSHNSFIDRIRRSKNKQTSPQNNNVANISSGTGGNFYGNSGANVMATYEKPINQGSMLSKNGNEKQKTNKPSTTFDSNRNSGENSHISNKIETLNSSTKPKSPKDSEPQSPFQSINQSKRGEVPNYSPQATTSSPSKKNSSTRFFPANMQPNPILNANNQTMNSNNFNSSNNFSDFSNNRNNLQDNSNNLSND
jgi:hypothetical protein